MLLFTPFGNKLFCLATNELFICAQAIYAINGITEPEQLESGNDAFEGLDSNHDGKYWPWWMLVIYMTT